MPGLGDLMALAGMAGGGGGSEGIAGAAAKLMQNMDAATALAARSVALQEAMLTELRTIRLQQEEHFAWMKTRGLIPAR